MPGILPGICYFIDLYLLNQRRIANKSAGGLVQFRLAIGKSDFF